MAPHKAPPGLPRASLDLARQRQSSRRRKYTYLQVLIVSMDSTVTTANPSNTAAATSGAVAEELHIDLRDRWLAAFLAWLVPGAGHLYQRRYGKGLLFMICILGTFFYGIFLGSNRVVYASFRQNDGTYLQDDARYAYLCQVGIGLPALPALVQAQRTGGSQPKAPLWNGFMAPPVIIGQRVPADWADELERSQSEDFKEFDAGDFEAAVPGYKVYRRKQAQVMHNRAVEYRSEENQLSRWHQKYGALYELGTVFTMVAGLLNVLAVFDAFGGPMGSEQPPSSDIEKKKK